MRVVLCLLSLMSSLACESPLADKLPPAPAAPTQEQVASEVEDAIFEKLECSEKLRPSTLQRIRDVLHDPSLEELRALLLAPQDLASVVALAPTQVEATVLVLRNLWLFVDSGTAHDLLVNGWDGVQCGDGVDLACTAGQENTTVTCDGADQPDRIALAFSGCTLQGTVIDGGFELLRVPGDDGVALLRFGDLTFDETDAWVGELLINVGVGDGALAAGLSGADALMRVEHGGLDRGIACSAETAFRVATLSVQDSVATARFDVSRQDPERTIGIETVGEHVTVDAAACACPVAGSGMLIDVPRPLGNDGEVAHARITWRSANVDGQCGRADVELTDWPTDCNVATNVQGDCAKAATTRVLEQLLSAWCVGS